MPARRQANANSESVDNYLKAILVLGGSTEQRVTSTALANRLGVAPASITNMLQKLAVAPEPMVEYERHRGVRLSPAGRRRALEIVRHHRLIETFLYEILDYPIEEVHDEAERLEHFISERFEERIAAKLGHPKTDPHGQSIPTMEGQMPVREAICLSEALAGGAYVIDSVGERDAETRRRLEATGLRVGIKLQVLPRTSAETCSVSIRRAGQPEDAIDLTAELAGGIRIVPFGI
ncbi:iron (metal) dependent repressor, DtxR family [Granulicella rosea]|uniref:Transcriptional regulator MntR n=1 Tax=Granulicella rosea TaxID=474952 RepID=A0A239DEA4_9BACT|nr:metal-dependent transcriptional regulator [Granulicella rosea]SNS30695.1 iron (metal) dependent repressor, DtxR family [Granulicella rosea]